MLLQQVIVNRIAPGQPRNKPPHILQIVLRPAARPAHPPAPWTRRLHNRHPRKHIHRRARDIEQLLRQPDPVHLDTIHGQIPRREHEVLGHLERVVIRHARRVNRLFSKVPEPQTQLPENDPQPQLRHPQIRLLRILQVRSRPQRRIHRRLDIRQRRVRRRRRHLFHIQQRDKRRI
ncbi:hypothetical protein CSIM01_01771 [Colletotrichum simmondsii]|uniref:Uncharacterized protein n=1 Tax=Colletotrichum simmondsii TaxID=703756 RepID=A0A135T4H8_9PEZI|nr:hypothetical protein CSIM01_01771 [Colletotrichum simmondsii]